MTGDDGHEYWTMAQCLEHTQVTKGTWSAYVTRAQAPAPAGHLNPRTPCGMLRRCGRGTRGGRHSDTVPIHGDA